jgi:CheY-like chemotaxis protein
MDDRAVPRLSPTVLLVDDETAIRSLLARRLEASGYRVISAASGREALEILTQEVVNHRSPPDRRHDARPDRAAAGRDRAVPLAPRCADWP